MAADTISNISPPSSPTQRNTSPATTTTMPLRCSVSIYLLMSGKGICVTPGRTRVSPTLPNISHQLHPVLLSWPPRQTTPPNYPYLPNKYNSLLLSPLAWRQIQLPPYSSSCPTASTTPPFSLLLPNGKHDSPLLPPLAWRQAQLPPRSHKHTLILHLNIPLYH